MVVKEKPLGGSSERNKPHATISKTDAYKKAISAKDMEEINDGLIDAIRHGSVKEVNYRLREGADPNMEDREGCAPIISAVHVNNIDICNLLLKKGADADGKDNQDWTAFMYAACTSDEKMCKFLLSHGADALANIVAMNKKGYWAQNLLNGKEIKALLKEYIWKSKTLGNMLGGRIGTFKESFGLCVS